MRFLKTKVTILVFHNKRQYNSTTEKHAKLWIKNYDHAVENGFVLFVVTVHTTGIVELIIVF